MSWTMNRSVPHNIKQNKTKQKSPTDLFSILHKVKSLTLSINEISHFFQTISIKNLIQLLVISISVSLTAVTSIWMTTARSYRMRFSKHTNQLLHEILLFLSVLTWFLVFRVHFIRLNIHWILARVQSLLSFTYFFYSPRSHICYYQPF